MIGCQRVKLEVSAGSSNEWPGEGKMAWTRDFLWQKIKVPGFCTHRGWQNRSKYRGQGHRQQVQRDAKNPNYPNKLGFCKFDQNLNHPSGGVGEAGLNIYVGLTHWAHPLFTAIRQSGSRIYKISKELTNPYFFRRNGSSMPRML